jgi:hypothetical protein
MCDKPSSAVTNEGHRGWISSLTYDSLKAMPPCIDFDVIMKEVGFGK